MNSRILCWFLGCTAVLSIGMPCVHADDNSWEFRGNLGLELQGFPQAPIHSADQRSNASVEAEVEAFRELGDSASVTITPFVRVDAQDEERTHGDFREFLFTRYGDTYELSIGLGKVFWGVAESVNLVDVVNQRDAVEGLATDDKLGQPMIRLTLLPDWGEVDFLILPGFRERTFAGVDGRPRVPVFIDTEQAQFQSDDKERHIDFAVRLVRTFGTWDVGVHAFQGTSRNPLFVQRSVPGVVAPYYYQITQTGLDVQATLESWLLKAEAIYVDADVIVPHTELVTGFEYSFYGIANSDADLGIVGEWLYDDRGDRSGQPFQNDALIGLRLALNDEQSTEALLGTTIDLDGGGRVISLEASRRFGDSFKLTADAVFWSDTDDDNVLGIFSREDVASLSLNWFF